MTDRDWIDQMMARNEKQAKYDADHTTRINLKLNNKTDADIIEWLKQQDSMQGSIKKLIRAAIAEEPKPEILGYWNSDNVITGKIAEEVEEVIRECTGIDDVVIPDYMKKHSCLKQMAKADRKRFEQLADYINSRIFS